MDRLHAFSYFLEGILPAAASDEVRAALRDGIVQVSQYLREIRPQFERSDVSAQLLRVRLLASQLADIELNAAEADEEFHRIPRFQVQSTMHASRGLRIRKPRRRVDSSQNPVSTAFCLQALEMWSDFQNGSRLDLPSSRSDVSRAVKVAFASCKPDRVAPFLARFAEVAPDWSSLSSRSSLLLSAGGFRIGQTAPGEKT